MLKKRIIGVIVIKAGIAVQSIGFKKYLPIGSPVIAVDYLNRWGIDEIVMLDIDATPEGRKPNIEMVKECSRNCHVPLSVGGGISEVADIRNVIHAGADKVVLNMAAFNNPQLITDGADQFGDQCIVVSIDAREIKENAYEAFVNSGRTATGRSPAGFAADLEKYGAGEIFLNSIDRDGSKQGYDHVFIQQVLDKVKIPVVACGGANHPNHFLAAIQLDISGLAAANFFHYTEHSVITTKQFLYQAGADIRLDSYANYNCFKFDKMGRADKMNDPVLDKLRFEFIPEEII